MASATFFYALSRSLFAFTQFSYSHRPIKVFTVHWPSFAQAHSGGWTAHAVHSLTHRQVSRFAPSPHCNPVWHAIPDAWGTTAALLHSVIWYGVYSWTIGKAEPWHTDSLQSSQPSTLLRLSLQLLIYPGYNRYKFFFDCLSLAFSAVRFLIYRCSPI